MVKGAVVGFPKEITAAAVKAFPADVAVLFLYTGRTVAVRRVAFLMMDSFIMEMAEGPPFVGINGLFVFHNIFLVRFIPGHFRIMGMVVMKGLFFMVVVMTAAAMMMAFLSFILTSGIIFMNMTFFVMLVMAVAAAAVMGMHCFFFFIHMVSSLQI